MKLVLVAAAVGALLGFGIPAQEDDRAAVNKTCPVMKGKLINKEILSVHKGSPIGFCCERCKKEWDQSPAEFEANLNLFDAPKLEVLAKLNKHAPEFELRDTDGYIARSADFAKKVILLQWVDPTCKVSIRVAAKVTAAMIEKAKKLDDKIVHLSICSDANAKREGLALLLSDHKIESRGLMDLDGSTARIFGAPTTCHIALIDAGGILRYAGAIDDDPTGKKGEKAVNHVLAALTALKEGKKVSPAATKPYGTPLKLLR